MNSAVNSGPTPLYNASQFAGIAVIGILAFILYQWAESAERRYRRGQLLAAYRERHIWKKSDVTRLKSLGVNKAAQNRMQRLAGTGRPVVKTHQPLEYLICSKLSAISSLLDKTASVEERKKAFKIWPWWPHYVEALYRGEHSNAKERGTRSASIEAELLVGAALGISSATVHSICGEIRSQRKNDEASADFPSMTLTEYNRLMANGFSEDFQAPDAPTL
jgi:hypothetical protein